MLSKKNLNLFPLFFHGWIQVKWGIEVEYSKRKYEEGRKQLIKKIDWDAN